MSWFRVDDQLWGSPQWLALVTKPRARALWITAGSWCMAHLTDGAVPKHVLPMLGGRTADAKALVEVGLWADDQGGWTFTAWDQPTRQEVEAKRKATADRVAQWRKDKASQRGNADSNDVGNAVTDGASSADVTALQPGDVTALVTPPPSRPGPTRPEGPGSGPGGTPYPHAEPARLTGEAITSFGAMLPEQVFEQLDWAAIDGICSRLVLAGWTRTALLAALDQRRAALGKARGPGLAMSVLRDLEHATPPRPDVCPNGCVDGWLNADSDRPTPCPTCKPATARRIAEQHAQPWTLGPRPTGRTA